MNDHGLDGVLKHYRSPSNYGAIADADATAEDVNELCGDRVRFQVKLEGTTVRRVGFVGDGCAIMVASASILTELATGRTVAEVAAISADELIDELGARVKPARRQCVELPLGVLREAVATTGGAD